MATNHSTKKSIGISFATQYMELVIHFLATLVLARILSPAEIGTYSVAAFLMTLLHVFRDFGVVQYLIQERELTADKISSAMGVAIILALSVAGILWISSGMVAKFYGNPAIEEVLVIMAASFAISPFGSLLLGLLRREMQLQKIFIIKIISALSHVAVAVSMAYHGFGPLSLAWANFAGILAFGAVANLMRPKNVPWMPRFTNIGKILSFGGIASLGNAANSAGTNIADLVIGKTMSMSAVGYFSRANGIVQLFTRLITSALSPLVLPYFAQMRREGKDLAAPYLAAVEYLTVLAWPFFVTMMLLAFPIVRTLYGAQWDASVPIVELLCVAGAISSMSLFAGQLMVANGQVGNSTSSQLLAQPFRVGAVLFASMYGLNAVATALIAAEIVTLAIASWYLHKTIRIGIAGILGGCVKSAGVAACTAIVPFAVNIIWDGDYAQPWLPLAIGVAGAAAGWLAGLFLFRHPLASHAAGLVDAFPIARDAAMSVKKTLKDIAYTSGALGIYHRLRNKDQLTVVMFHRVLPASDPRYAGADPEWTMTPESFEQCLRFFRKHYNIVSPDQVFAAMRGDARLPQRSLLVTFDDGWADTAEFAHPILSKFMIRAHIFIAGEAINETRPFWEERVFEILSTCPDGATQLNAALEKSGVRLDIAASGTMNESAIREVIRRLGTFDRSVHESLLDHLGSAKGSVPAMVNGLQLSQMLASSHGIGGHGMTHQPLTKVKNLPDELERAQEILSNHLDGKRVLSMSFPHGAYSEQVLTVCRSAGYRYFFSSDAILNAVGASISDKPIGRIHIPERAITDQRGRFEPARLAAWLFMRPLGRGGAQGDLHHA